MNCSYVCLAEERNSPKVRARRQLAYHRRMCRIKGDYNLHQKWKQQNIMRCRKYRQKRKSMIIDDETVDAGFINTLP